MVAISLCECGCGAPTSSVRRRFIAGHQRKLTTEAYRVDPDTGCWVWQRAINKKTGYGATCVHGRVESAHVVYYEAVHGPVPDGMEIDHTCRNRRCCNPSHLEVVTHTENVRRGAATKLTTQQVADIRHRVAAGGVRYRDLASEYGVWVQTIGRIVRHESWMEATR